MDKPHHKPAQRAQELPSSPPAGAPLEPLRETERAGHREQLAGYRLDIHRFVVSRVRDRNEADDITQQTLQRAIERLDSFHGGNLRAWLFCLARHAIVNRGRTHARTRAVSYDEETMHQNDRPLTAPDTVEMSCDARARIQNCLDCMSARLRTAEEVAVLLSDVHGCSDRESAARLGIPLSRFKSLLHRARTHLHAAAGVERPGNPCPLVSKTGAHTACPGCASDAGAGRDGGNPHPTGLDAAALSALRKGLIDALDVNGSGRVKHATR